MARSEPSLARSDAGRALACGSSLAIGEWLVRRLARRRRTHVQRTFRRPGPAPRAKMRYPRLIGASFCPRRARSPTRSGSLKTLRSSRAPELEVPTWKGLAHSFKSPSPEKNPQNHPPVEWEGRRRAAGLVSGHFPSARARRSLRAGGTRHVRPLRHPRADEPHALVQQEDASHGSDPVADLCHNPTTHSASSSATGERDPRTIREQQLLAVLHTTTLTCLR